LKSYKGQIFLLGKNQILKILETFNKRSSISKNKIMKNIAKIIDHTNIRKGAKREDILRTCEEAKKHGFRGVCVRLEWVKLVSKELKRTQIKTVTLIDPPIGDSLHKIRVKMCKKAKKDGADELDVVMNIVDAKHERWEKILKDLKEICKILPTKIIIGSGYLTDQEIIKASQIVKKAGAFCVKTATEKDPLEHRELKEKFYHLKLMRKGAPGLLIKAAGGIRTLKDLKGAVRAGADIIGTSFGVEIIKELLKN
jgi:deoxyribose-phosphate aldolase